MPAGSSSLARSAVADEASAIRPFHVSFPQAELTDLRRRVNATRWPERETVTDATQGVQLTTIRKLADYWGKDHDWGKCEAKLKAWPHFITEIDGLDIQPTSPNDRVWIQIGHMPGHHRSNKPAATIGVECRRTSDDASSYKHDHQPARQSSRRNFHDDGCETFHNRVISAH
jgi:hypothetical protein